MQASFAQELPNANPSLLVCDAHKENIDANLFLNLQSTVEIKRKPTEGSDSERKATLRSVLRSNRSSEEQPPD